MNKNGNIFSSSCSTYKLHYKHVICARMMRKTFLINKILVSSLVKVWLNYISTWFLRNFRRYLLATTFFCLDFPYLFNFKCLTRICFYKNKNPGAKDTLC